MLDIKNEPALKDGEPCSHPGCLSHVSHPCEGCGRIGGYERPPETIYLQWYRDEVTWCRDQLNDNDAVYVLATPELVGLLERLSRCPLPNTFDDPYLHQRMGDRTVARMLATRLKDSLG